MKKPDFFLVGAPKCGTTAMCDYLDQHPDIFISTVKEPNYFGKDLIGPKAVNNIEDYLNLFQQAGSRLCGEGSVWSLFSKTAAKEIYDFNCNAKIIIMLRNPVDVIYSLHNQMVFDGYHEDIEDFKLALAAESDRKKGLRIPKTCTRPQALIYTDVVKFTEQVQRYINIFSKENINVIVYDDFKNKTFQIYHDTLNFLGVNPDFEPDIKVINASKRVKSKTLQKFLVAQPPVVQFFSRSILPKPLRPTIRTLLKSFNTRYQPSPPMDAELRRCLQTKFAPEVQQLSSLLGRDLTYWSKG
jgi:hypothetical protein